MDNNQSTKTSRQIDPFFAGRSILISPEISETSIRILVEYQDKPILCLILTTFDAANGDLTFNMRPYRYRVRMKILFLGQFLQPSLAIKTDMQLGIRILVLVKIPYADQSYSNYRCWFFLYTVTDAVYTASSGSLVAYSSHGFTISDCQSSQRNFAVHLSLDSNLDSRSPYHSCTSYDYPSGHWLEISNVTTTLKLTLVNYSFLYRCSHIYWCC